MMTCVTVYLVVAWRVLSLLMRGRMTPGTPRDAAFDDAEWKSAHQFVQGAVFPIHAGAAPMYLFSEVLGIPFAFGGVGHGAGSHGPNEYILLDDVTPFMKSVASFFFRYGAHHAAQTQREA